ncbi:MAG TPA: VCBS repeat-containing protein [Polyangium sp.]|nr:VCBS repeat-containing protein [Polyangium sp.]
MTSKRQRGYSPLTAMTIMALLYTPGCGVDTARDTGAGGKTLRAEENSGFADYADLRADLQEAGEKNANAPPCTVPGDCPSGFCVDGVCCDRQCSGLCQACTAAKKGSGVDGVCANIVNGLDPDNECAGTCNGFGRCTLGGVLLGNGSACMMGSECSSGFCIDGVCCNSSCTGACQACTAMKKGSGSDGTCGNIAPATDPDNECSLGNCNGVGACGTGILLGNGVACSNAGQCASAQCVDGVCCDSACTGSCQACNIPGSLGTCSNHCASTCPNGMELTNAAVYNVSAVEPAHLMTGDFNNDGQRDVAISPGASWRTTGYAVAFGQGNGLLGPATTVSMANWYSYLRMAVDANRNGHVDLNEQHVGIDQLWADFSGDGILDEVRFRVVPGDPGWGPAEYRNTEYFMDVYIGNANGSFTLNNSYGTASFSPWALGSSMFPEFAAGDFNGDGKLDIAVDGYDRVVSFFGRGDGTFGYGTSPFFNPYGPSLPYGVHATDVNQDGNVDVLVHWNDYSAHVYLGFGNGTFSNLPRTISGGEIRVLILADITHDGKVDLLLPQFSLPGVILLRPGNGDGTFGAGTTYRISSTDLPGLIHIADMDGDTRDDVLFGNSANDTMGISFNRCLP